VLYEFSYDLSDEDNEFACSMFAWPRQVRLALSACEDGLDDDKKYDMIVLVVCVY